MERGFARRCGSHRQVADSHIDPNHLLVTFKRGVRLFYFQGDEQVELLVGLVVPELGIADAGSMVDESQVRMIALIGEGDPSFKSYQAHTVSTLETIITSIGILESR